ncbi:MAG: hypothetical protein FJY97_18975 [candidate division Zixibacteria bacterium]|nr:hypothetical protein [candidate division Zixibacteria bacterium]
MGPIEHRPCTGDDRRQKVDKSGVALYVDGINVHTFLLPRETFRRTVEGAIHNSFSHSLLAKGTLLYTHDPTIGGWFDRLRVLGDRDTQIKLLGAATDVLPAVYKAHKWMVTRGDLDYTALWILYAATPLARMEVISAGSIADREVIPQASTLNPAFFKIIYNELLNTVKTPERVQTALDAVDSYLAHRSASLFAPVFDYLREAGEARSCTEIEDHFKRHFDIENITTACEYLADQGLIGKAATPVHLTKKSNIEMQELAFFYTGEPTGRENRKEISTTP